MAPKSEASAPPASTLPGLWKYPKNREKLGINDVTWLEGRRQDDGAEGLWRIHDTLYDLTNFVQRHPGGAEWLEITKGTDITEAFEAHHVSSLPGRILSKYTVRAATTRRNSPYTFEENGFYRTLRRRVFEVMPRSSDRGFALPSRIIGDTLMSSTFITAISAAVWRSSALAMLAGVFLAMTTVSAHNFCHQKYNFRRFYFHLCGLSTKHWSVIHILSHHLYPNSVHDLEISMVEPWFEYLPKNKRLRGYLSWLMVPYVFIGIFPFEFLRYLLVHGPSVPDLLLPMLIPGAMVGANQLGLVAPPDVLDTLKVWLYTMVTGSIWFSATGAYAGHHHPEIFHDGDAPRADRDWGLAQLDSVRDRRSVSGVKSSNSSDKEGHLVVKIDSSGTSSWLKVFLVLTNFGHHTLHHLFPTIDHYYLPKLYPILEQTLSEFGVPFETTTALECVKGQFKLLVKTEPNPIPPGAKDNYKKNLKLKEN